MKTVETTFFLLTLQIAVFSSNLGWENSLNVSQNGKNKTFPIQLPALRDGTRFLNANAVKTDSFQTQMSYFPRAQVYAHLQILAMICFVAVLQFHKQY